MRVVLDNDLLLILAVYLAIGIIVVTLDDLYNRFKGTELKSYRWIRFILQVVLGYGVLGIIIYLLPWVGYILLVVVAIWPYYLIKLLKKFRSPPPIDIVRGKHEATGIEGVIGSGVDTIYQREFIRNLDTSEKDVFRHIITKVGNGDTAFVHLYDIAVDRIESFTFLKDSFASDKTGRSDIMEKSKFRQMLMERMRYLREARADQMVFNLVKTGNHTMYLMVYVDDEDVLNRFKNWAMAENRSESRGINEWAEKLVRVKQGDGNLFQRALWKIELGLW